MRLSNGILEIGGEQVGMGVPVLAIEHTDLTDLGMAGMGIPNIFLPSLMGKTTPVELPFTDDGAYRIVDTNGLPSMTGYVFVQSMTMSGAEAKILFVFSLQGGLMMAQAVKQEDGTYIISMEL